MSGPATLAALALAATLQATGAPGPAPPKPRSPACILLSSGSDTQYTPVDDHTIIIRSMNRWWALTTTPSSLMLQPQAFLVNEIHGTSTLCSPLDFQLSVVEPPGAREGLIAQEFHELTPEEGRARLRAARR